MGSSANRVTSHRTVWKIHSEGELNFFPNIVTRVAKELRILHGPPEISALKILEENFLKY